MIKNPIGKKLKREVASCIGSEMTVTGKGFKRKIHGYRSIHEYRFAEYLKVIDVDFIYEHDGMKVKDELGTQLHYVPDFYLPKKKIYIEIVTHGANKLKRHKLLWMQEQHPDKKLMLITAKEVKSFFRGWKDLF